MFILLLLFIIFTISIYLLFYYDDYKHEIKEKRRKIIRDEKIFILSNKKYLCVNPSNSLLYLSDKIENAYIFKIHKISQRKYVIKSIELNKYIMINYTILYKNQYDVLVNSDTINNISCQLIISKRKNKYYAKFYNGHYLCGDINGNLYASLDRKERLLFKFKRVDELN